MNARALLLNLVNVSSSSFVLLGHDEVGGLSGGTTGAHDTTGATLIAISVSWFGGSGVTVSDSKSNTYTGLTPQQSGAPFNSQIYYVNGPTVGAAHTFTIAGVAASIAVIYFSGSSSGFDSENGSFHNGGFGIMPGNITTTIPQELVITGLSADPMAGAITIDSGMTAFTLDGVAGTRLGVGVAYKLIVSPTSISPFWSWPVSTGAAATIASFKP